MDEAYSDYLNSNVWREKRVKRLAMDRFRCASCGSKQRVEVHHLTYERIFHELMSDLLPLCYLHHQAAEEMVSKGMIARTGDTKFLAKETLRLIKPRQEKKGLVIVAGLPASSNRTQENLLKEFWFEQSLSLKRKAFKRLVRSKFHDHPHKSCMMANAFALYQRRASMFSQQLGGGL